MRDPDSHAIAVGDLVQWLPVRKLNTKDDEWDELGIVLMISRSGATSFKARILFGDNSCDWIDTSSLLVIKQG